MSVTLGVLYEAIVNKGIELEMQEIKKGKVKTKSLESIKKKYNV